MNQHSKNSGSEHSKESAKDGVRPALGDGRASASCLDVFGYQFQQVVGPNVIQSVGQRTSGPLFRREINRDNSGGFQPIEALHQQGVIYPRRLVQLVSH